MPLLKLKSAEIRNFMSFGPDPVRVELNGKGLLLLEGENQVSLSASSNGSGKTNLIEAIAWAFYGKTTKGVAADDVVNDTSRKDLVVTVEVEDEDRLLYRVRRTRKHKAHGTNLFFDRRPLDGDPETWEALNGVDVNDTQTKVEQFLGQSFALFCNASYFSQNNLKPFSLYTDKQIKDVLMEALDLGRFAEALEQKVRPLLKDLRKEQGVISGKIERAESEIDEARERQRKYKLEESAFEDRKARNLKALDEEIDVLVRRLDDMEDIEEKVARTAAEIVSMEEGIAKRTDPVTELTEVRGKAAPLAENRAKITGLIAGIRRDQTTAERTLMGAEDRIGTNCRECGKEIRREDLAGVIEAAREKLKACSAQMTKYVSLMEKADVVLDGYRKKEAGLETAKEAMEADRLNLRKLAGQLDTLKARLEEVPRIEGAIEALEKRKKEAAAEVCGVTPFIDTEDERIVAAEKAIKGFEEALAAKEEEIRISEYWETAFGYAGIPSFLLDSVVPFLDERSNHYTAVMCGGEIEIRFQTTSKTKAGKVRDRFAIDIRHRHGAGRYKGISGGERKRADMCIAQAIQDLVRSYGRSALDFVVYDEPFENIDATGVDGVMNLVREIAGTMGTVMVVTHNDELKAMFDNSIRVVKGIDKFSRIEA